VPIVRCDPRKVIAVGSPPVVLRDGAELSPRQWELCRENAAVRHWCETGELKTEDTIDEIVSRELERQAYEAKPATPDLDPLEMFESPEDDEG
jgi:hypothetical protein